MCQHTADLICSNWRGYFILKQKFATPLCHSHTNSSKILYIKALEVSYKADFSACMKFLFSWTTAHCKMLLGQDTNFFISSILFRAQTPYTATVMWEVYSNSIHASRCVQLKIPPCTSKQLAMLIWKKSLSDPTQQIFLLRGQDCMEAVQDQCQRMTDMMPCSEEAHLRSCTKFCKFS